MKFLRSLPAKWDTHVVMWRNKADLDTMSFDDLYNNLKIIELEVKRTVTSSSSLGSQNMAFLSSLDSTNDVDTVNIQVSTVSTPVSTISTHDNTANLSDATMYAFLANQPNRSQLVHEDLEQIHEDDLEEISLKWKLALLSMRARRRLRNQESRPRNQDNSRKTVIVEDTSSKEMVAIDGAGFDWSYMAMMKFQPTWLLWLSRTQRNFAPTSVLTKSGIIPISTAGQSSSRAAASVSAARPINIAAPKPILNVKSVNTAKGKSMTSAVGKQGIDAVKSSTCWVWRLKIKGDPQDTLKDTRIFDSNSKGGKITGKGKIRTGKLDFEDVYFMKELKFNLFSVSQMCDKKNGVLFTETECLILSPEFKLPDENQVLLKVPRKNNMYSFDLKNVVLSKGLTCLFAKATNDESNLWHRRLGHINFKIMNKLVKRNLFSWVFFLAKKDETSGILKDFITGIENQFNHKVKIIKYDNGTEFKNYEMNQFCKIKGIKREFGNARTPQQNGVAKRKNRTLIEAARTIVGNKTNGNASSEIHSDARKERKEKVPDQEYILLPVLNTSLDILSSHKEAVSSPKDDAGKKSTIEPTHQLKAPNKGSQETNILIASQSIQPFI
uniref:Ribonuclease H-like domain-containing protein n=1 Tax=Tanacetum cinerariifolium TaxID=118510 RepID=A0A699HKH0_TANCI|nr:ribonuclease H-like domain-containing protein [Tanacetum cinerariifolium]